MLYTRIYYHQYVVNMDRIDLFRTFAAVAETGSFTAAADQLDFTPQLVSKYVRVLEDQLDVQLFTRSTRSVRLTETGAACLARCNQLLEDFEHLTAEIRAEHIEPMGRLKISAPTTFGEEYIAPILPEFLKKYPEVTIDLNLTDRYVRLVDEGYDVAIRIGQLEDSSLIAKRIASASILLCASPAYIANYGLPQVPENLISHTSILDTNYRDKNIWNFMKDGNAHKIKIKDTIRVNSANAVRCLLLNGSGIGVGPSYALSSHIKNRELVQLLPDYNIANLGIYAIYLEDRYLSAKIRAFVDFLSEQPDWKKVF